MKPIGSVLRQNDDFALTGLPPSTPLTSTLGVCYRFRVASHPIVNIMTAKGRLPLPPSLATAPLDHPCLSDAAADDVAGSVMTCRSIRLRNTSAGRSEAPSWLGSEKSNFLQGERAKRSLDSALLFLRSAS